MRYYASLIAMAFLELHHEQVMILAKLAIVDVDGDCLEWVKWLIEGRRNPCMFFGRAMAFEMV
jgi:hypothetical protein